MSVHRDFKPFIPKTVELAREIAGKNIQRRSAKSMGLNRVFLVFFALTGALGHAVAQGTSNKGTDFWVAYTGHVDNKVSRLTLFLTAEKAASVQISAGGTLLPTVAVPANQATPVVIDPNVYSNVYVGLAEGTTTGAGIHVTSDVPIVVYSHISNNARSAASLIFPTKALGNEYYTISYAQSATTSTETKLSEFDVVGVEDGTSVKITPTQKSVTGNHLADTSFTITLNKGDVYQYVSTTDLTGSKVETVGGCRPIAVFSGSSKTGYCETGSTGGSEDNLYQQLLPLSAWGKNFVTAPFYNATKGSTDIYRILVGKDNATIKVNGSTSSANGVALRNPYAKGSVITFTSQSSNVIESNQPISVTQFQTTQICNPNNAPVVRYPGDPEMTILNPIEQTLTDVTLYSAVNRSDAPSNIITHYINVILETSDIPNFRIDGAAVSSSQFIAINSKYSYLIYDATNSSKTNPSHRVTSQSGFVAIAYGYGSFESYGYLAGSDLRNLNQNIVASSAGSKVPSTAGCANAPYDFTLRLPYITNSINWDFGNGKTYTEVSPQYTVDASGPTPAYLYEYNQGGGVTYPKGSFTITAIVINPAPAGCDANETVTFTFDIYAPPAASFSAPKETCFGAPVAFSDKSTDAQFAVSSWNWDFGDNTFSTQQNPSHVYTAAGTYTVKLTVGSGGGCSSEVYTDVVTINSPPTANFSAGAVACETRSFVFTDNSVANSGTIVSRRWIFGDGKDTTVTTGGTMSHTFAKSGTYSVSLQVTTDRACTSTVFSQNLTVNPLPLVDFDLPEVCLDDAFAKFNNKTSIADNSALSYSWNFGDANATPAQNSSNQVSPSHKYSRSGYYDVVLTVSSPYGCSVSLKKTLTVNGSVPKADFTILNGSQTCSSDSVRFLDKSSVDFGNVTRLEIWYDLNDPSVTKFTDEDPKGKTYAHLYPVLRSTTALTRTVTVKMVTYSGSGLSSSCVAEKTATFTLKAVPLTNFAAVAPICQEKPPISLLPYVSESTGIAGSGAFSGTGVSAAGLFNPAQAGIGDHLVTYTYTATNGCTDQKTCTITVYATPTANAGADLHVLEGGQTRINALATGRNLTYRWTPAKGLSDPTMINPVTTPTDDITYTLTVTSDQGCTASDQVFIKVLKAPEVPNAFTPNSDGVNDRWEIKYLETYPGATIDVFNRYGDKVYFSAGYTSAWDGTAHGEPLPGGTYYYIINPKNGRKLVKGSVTIFR